MGRIGLEWLLRLVSQPGRLAFRYLVEPWSLVPLALDDLKRHRPIQTPVSATAVVMTAQD
jgi:N-acetylglucosaminyldiphosphoundecaprenol N-acetyl-beta-D-mannosaminyltransferase